MILEALDIYNKSERNMFNQENAKFAPMPYYIDNEEDKTGRAKIENLRKQNKDLYGLIGCIHRETTPKKVSDIKIANLTYPDKDSMRYYYEYIKTICRMREEAILPQEIIVNEQNILLAGYESYLFFKDYNIKEIPSWYVAQNITSLEKAIVFRAYHYQNGELVLDTENENFIYYNLKQPVVPGDDLIICYRSKLLIGHVDSVVAMPDGFYDRDIVKVIRHACKQDFEIYKVKKKENIII